MSRALAYKVMCDILDNGLGNRDADAAMLVSGSQKQFNDDDLNAHFGSSFLPSEVELTLKNPKNKAQPPVTQKCVLLQVCGPKVLYKPDIIPTMTIDAPVHTDIFLIAYEKELSKALWSSLKGRNASSAFEQLSLKTVPSTAKVQGSALEILINNKPPKKEPDPWGAFVKAKINVKT